MSIPDFNMHNFPAAIAIVLVAAGMVCQHKNIVYEDSRFHTDHFRLWSEIILMAAYGMILPTAAEQFTEPLRTPDGLIEAWGVALATSALFCSSLLRFLKHKKKLKENREESL